MRKLTTVLLVAVLVIMSVLPAAAKENVALADAVKLAKSFFPTEGFTEFWSNTEMYNGKTTYYLYWSEKQEPSKNPARMSVRVDAQRKIITGYSYEPGYKEEQFPALPKLGKEHCQAAAEEFLRKLIPGQFAAMKLEKVDEPEIRLEKRYWPHSYTFRYVQYVNGVPFAINNLWVRVNADTGAVQDYYLAWEDYEFPSPEGVLSLDEAGDVFKELGLKLVYLRQYSWRENTSKPYLAYVLENGQAMQIDAFTGEVTYGSSNMYYTGEQKRMVEGLGLAKDEGSFTPWELEEMELIAGLLSAEEAEAQAREAMQLPEKLRLQSSRLLEDKAQNARCWYLNWEYTEENNYMSASARLNAADGEIQSFNVWDKYDDKQEPKLTYDEALSIAKEFLQKWVPAKYGSTELVSKYELKEGEPLPYAYSFTFERRENGLPVMGDSLSLTVQHDKRITSFYSNWYTGEFPTAEGVLAAEEMSALFLSNVGLNLQYVHHFNTEAVSKFTMPTVKLVYKAKELPSYSFNPFTGKNIDHQGKEIVPVVKPDYTDLSGHWAEADVLRLVDLGLLHLPGPEFNPDAVIKLGELLKMLADASGQRDTDQILPIWLKSYATNDNTTALWYGVSRGIITEKDKELDPETLVSREMLAFYLARMQGYSNVTSLKGIWSAPYNDFASVSADYQGAVAITHALGLLGSGAPGKFLPKDYTTKAQVAVVLSRMLDMAN